MSLWLVNLVITFFSLFRVERCEKKILRNNLSNGSSEITLNPQIQYKIPFAALLTRSCTMCSSEAVPTLHDPSLMLADAAHLRQCQPWTILHSCSQTLLTCGSASLARSCTHAGRRCSSAAVPALHDTSRRHTLLTCGSASLARYFTQAYAAHLRQCQPSTILHAGIRCSSAAVPALHDTSRRHTLLT